MTIFSRRAATGIAIALATVTVPTMLASPSAAAAGQCRGSKVVQSCSNNALLLQGQCSAYISDPGGGMYQTCIATANAQATTTCQPVRVPCDYDETSPLGPLQQLFK